VSNSRLLAIYLNDHLAGSAVGLELVRRARAANGQSEYGTFLARLTEEIEADRDALLDIMRSLGVHRDRAKEAAGWVAEKLGRLKLNGQLTGYSPLSRLVELEALLLGVTGKLAGWRALALVADDEPRLERARLERLAERAERQRAELEHHRQAAIREALM
jgi:hypothetical protein